MQRRITGAAGAGAVVVLLLAGCSSGDGSAQDPVTVTQTVEAPDPTATGPTSPTPTTSATPTVRPTPYAVTAKAHAAPWKDKNADFGLVSAARVVSGGVQITFDRATWLFADQVATWNKDHPKAQVEEADDYAIGNQSPQKRVFLVRTGAAVFGSILLSDQPEPKKISLSQLAARISAAGSPVTVWIYHRYGGLTGDVVQLEEQYRP